METNRLPFSRRALDIFKELLLVEEDIGLLLNRNNAIALPRAEPLQLSLLLGQWPCLRETRRAQHWND
jgi:hypothetical protein